jgi:hypothetical protein
MGLPLKPGPMARANSCTVAPLASQRAAMLLIELMRWARKALAVSLESSLLQRSVTFRNDVAGRHPLAADQHPIGSFEIADGRAFRQELGAGEHRKAPAIGSRLGFRCAEDGGDHLGGAHGQGAFLHHDRVTLGAGGQLTDRSPSALRPAAAQG